MGDYCRDGGDSDRGRDRDWQTSTSDQRPAGTEIEGDIEVRGCGVAITQNPVL